MQSQYDVGLDKTPANYVALTPLSFLKRSAAVFPDHVSAVYEGRVFTWSQTYARCRRFASGSPSMTSATAIRSRRCCRISLP
jgi:fatty-acyl-CoA synthase